MEDSTFIFIILHIITKFQQTFKFCPMAGGGGPFTPPFEGFLMHIRPYFFPQRCARTQGFKLQYKTKNGKILPFLMGVGPLKCIYIANSS